MRPITIFDKSALQALSMDEAALFEALLLANMVPVFYVETLADLEKEVTGGSTPEDVVGMLAAKTPSNAAPNVHHRELLLANLIGQFDATGVAVIREGEAKRAPDGMVGVHVGEFTERTALLRWMEGDFLEVERQVARGWRAELAQHDPTPVIAVLRETLLDVSGTSDLQQLKEEIDAFCARGDPKVLQLAFEVLDVPVSYREAAVKRWEAEGKPLDEFAPYFTHVLKVDLLFYLAIDRGSISGERKSNKADMAYLYYLPFSMVFVSGDKLHHRTAPLFLRESQSYVKADELKAALRQLDEHYSSLPDEIKQLGVLQFAAYPPPEMDNVVTRLWDKHMGPGWRESARTQQARLGEPRDEAAERATIAELEERMREAQTVPAEEARLAESTPDYLFIQRRVPAKKGKWRMVPKDVEARDEEA